ncbi:MAG: sulfatase [Planctomycetota bacterium]
MTLKIRLVIKILSCVILVFAGGCRIDNLQIVRPEKLTQIKNRPNVILITISSLRADHVSSLGYDRQTTPNFDRFAKDNIIFTNAFATSSWQMPSIGSIFTSLYPTEHGATHINNKLGQEVRTLAEILKENSFYTAGFSCNPRLSGDYGFDQGFDFYDDYSASMMLSSMSFGQEDSFDINKRRTNDLVNDAVVRWLQNNTHSSFFLFVHYYDNHWDYLPPTPYNAIFDPDYQGDIDGTEIAREPLYSNRPSDKNVEHIIALYDGQIRQTDQDLGELLDFLKEQGRFIDSVIIVMGDHGEQFYEHGHTSHHGIFDELIHVPLAVSVPDVNTPGTVEAFASGVDIIPTILDYTKISELSEGKGKSLKPLIDKEAEKLRDFVFIEYTGGAVPDCFGVRFSRYKFIRQEEDIFAYDLETDPAEQKKIYKNDFSGQMNEMFEKIEHFLAQDKPLPENQCKQ